MHITTDIKLTDGEIFDLIYSVYLDKNEVVNYEYHTKDQQKL